MSLWKKLTTPIGEQHPEWQDKVNEKFDTLNTKLESNIEKKKKLNNSKKIKNSNKNTKSIKKS